MRQSILVVDDVEMVRQSLALLLEKPGRTTILCSDLQTAEIMLSRTPVDHLVTDVQFSGSFGFEGLHFIERIRKTNPRCGITLMTGQATDELRRTARAMGATDVLAKPFDIDALEEAIGEPEPGECGTYEIVHVASLDDILAGGVLQTVFQPIVDVGSTNAVVAFEALTRLRDGWPAGGPAELFEYAARLDRVRELNFLAIECALDAASRLPTEASLFLNVDPAAFAPDLATFLETAARRAGVALSRIVIEVTERTQFDADSTQVCALFRSLRAMGVRFALDDHGSSYSHLALLDALRPSFIKISHTFGNDIEEDDMHRRIVAHMAAFSRDVGCRTILEGIESETTARVAEMLGVDLAQGYHFGRPAGAAHWGRPCTAA